MIRTTVPAALDADTGGAGGATTGAETTTSNGAGEGGAGGGPAEMPCIGTATASLRFTNLVPEASAVDFCLGAHENLSGPVAKLASAPDGVAYSSFMTYDYKVEGPIDIKVVPAGAACSAQGLAELQNVCLTGSAGPSAISLYVVGGASFPRSLISLPNEPKDVERLRLRFLHAAATPTPLDFGLTENATLPATVDMSVSLGVAFKGVPKAGNTALNAPIDPAGYLVVDTLPPGIAAQGWAAAYSGGVDAVAIAPFSSAEANHGNVLTIAAVGLPGDANYPFGFVVFDELEKAPVPKTQESGVVQNLK